MQQWRAAAGVGEISSGGYFDVEIRRMGDMPISMPPIGVSANRWQ